ncbi:Ig-like domain-containing protein [Leptospira sp. 96542]|nr:Ig-like domain-containing protein [Leptospira sp. 96542]
MKLVRVYLIFFGFFGFNQCLPEPEPNLIGILAIPIFGQTSPDFYVESTDPVNDSTLPTNTVLRITFTQLIDSTYLTGRISCAPILFCPTLNGSVFQRVLVLSPASSYTATTVYTITINKTIRSSYGLEMADHFIYRFTAE